MNLYVITGTAPHDLAYDLSLIVATDNIERAADFWRDYYELEEGEEPERIFHLMPGIQFAFPEGPFAWDGQFLPQIGGTAE